MKSYNFFSKFLCVGICAYSVSVYIVYQNGMCPVMSYASAVSGLNEEHQHFLQVPVRVYMCIKRECVYSVSTCIKGLWCVRLECKATTHICLNFSMDFFIMHVHMSYIKKHTHV